jgi:Leucine-rich repeat (LRR) protein
VASRITALDVCGTPFRDFPLLAKFEKLKKLRLTGMPISDLSPLAKLADLEELDMAKTPVQSLRPLLGLTKLKKVVVVDVKVPPAELAALKKALPDAQLVERFD